MNRKFFNKSHYLFDLWWRKRKPSPCIIWITGLSGSGKTTIATELFNKLKSNNYKCILLDGDEMRNIFPSPIGFDREARVRHNMNIGCMASILERQGYIVIVGMISPFIESRNKCREISKKFIEVYLSTSLEVCEMRDVKGLYKKARNGEMADFTGISSPYEPPINPELNIDTSSRKISDCVKEIIKKINEH